MASTFYESKYRSFQWAMPVSFLKKWRVGFNYRSAQVTDIAGTERQGVNQRLVLTGENISYLGQGMTVATGRTIETANRRYAVGASFTYIKEKAAGFSADGTAASVGGSVDLPRDISAAFVAQNLIKTPLRWSGLSSRDTVATSYRLGAHYAPKEKAYVLSTEYRLQSYEEALLSFGIEYAFIPEFRVRAGLHGDDLRLGTGLYIHPIRIDFSWSPAESELTADHYKFAIHYQFR